MTEQVQVATCRSCSSTKLGAPGKRPVLLRGHGILCWWCANGGISPEPEAPRVVRIQLDQLGVTWELHGLD